MTGMLSLDRILAMPSVDAEARGGRTVADTLPGKRHDSGYSRLVASVRREGMHTPVLIADGVVCNGMHRIAAAQDLRMADVPWTDDIMEGYSGDDAL